MENVYKIDAADVYDIVRKKYDENDIVEAAIKGLRHGYKSGQAVFDIEKRTIYTRSLGTGEYVQNDKDVVLYTVDQNILGNESFADDDWLTEKEISDWESRDMGRQEYIKKYTSDTVESRLADILEHYFDWDELAETISRQFEVV